MVGESSFEIWIREPRKRGRAPLQMVACFKQSFWQFACKRAARLRRSNAEVVLRKVTITDEVVTKRPKKAAPGAA